MKTGLHEEYLEAWPRLEDRSSYSDMKGDEEMSGESSTANRIHRLPNVGRPLDTERQQTWLGAQ